MKNLLIRLTIFSSVWIVFWIVSTAVYTSFIHDAGGAFWSLGIFAFPVILFAFYLADRKLQRQGWVQAWPISYLALMCIVGLLLYIPGVMGVLFAVYRM